MGQFRGTEVGLSRATSGFRKGFEFVQDSIAQHTENEQRKLDLEERREERKNIQEFKDWLSSGGKVEYTEQQAPAAPTPGVNPNDLTKPQPTGGYINPKTGGAPRALQDYGPPPTRPDAATYQKQVNQWRDKFLGTKVGPEFVDKSITGKQVFALGNAINSWSRAVETGDFSGVEAALKEADYLNPNGKDLKLYKGTDGKLYTQDGIEITQKALVERQAILKDPQAERAYQDQVKQREVENDQWKQTFDQAATQFDAKMDQDKRQHYERMDMQEKQYQLAKSQLGFEERKYDEMKPFEQDQIRSQILVNWGKYANDYAKANGTGAKNMMTPSQTMTWDKNTTEAMDKYAMSQTNPDFAKVMMDPLVNTKMKEGAMGLGVLNGVSIGQEKAARIAADIEGYAAGIPLPAGEDGQAAYQFGISPSTGQPFVRDTDGAVYMLPSTLAAAAGITGGQQAGMAGAGGAAQPAAAPAAPEGGATGSWQPNEAAAAAERKQALSPAAKAGIPSMISAPVSALGTLYGTAQERGEIPFLNMLNQPKE